MKITRISFSEFESLAPQITELLAKSHQSQPFLTPEWLITWWQFWGKQEQSYLLIAQENQQLIGFAPLKLSTQSWLNIRILSLINNQVAADHLDWVSLPEYEEAVCTEFFQYLHEHNQEWDVLCLDDLSPDSICLKNLTSMDNSKYSIRQSAGQLCPYLPLQGDWEQYLSQKSKNFRQQTRAKRRKVVNQLKAQWHRAETPEQIEAALDTLAALNPQRWNQKGENSGFSQSQFCQFHQSLAKLFDQNGWLDLNYLAIDSQIIAVIYNYRYRNKIYYYNTAFDSQYARFSIGRVLMGFSIEQAFQSEYEEFDFLRGVHQYKYEWSELQRQNQDLMILPKRIKPYLWDSWNRLKITLREKLKSHLSPILQQKIKTLLLKKEDDSGH